MLAADITADVPRPLADWFEGFVPMKQHTLIRFGLWHEILGQPLPEDHELFAVMTAMMRYSRMVALADKRELTAAEAERDQFHQALDRVQENRMPFNNTCQQHLSRYPRRGGADAAWRVRVSQRQSGRAHPRLLLVPGARRCLNRGLLKDRAKGPVADGDLRMPSAGTGMARARVDVSHLALVPIRHHCRRSAGEVLASSVCHAMRNVWAPADLLH
ncbi:MAG: hypothetical protein KDK91_28270 [Gammaproteobacteria bacterium]|nr:hypothetical protein [Gammaproteobacteria bacterium]